MVVALLTKTALSTTPTSTASPHAAKSPASGVDAIGEVDLQKRIRIAVGVSLGALVLFLIGVIVFICLRRRRRRRGERAILQKASSDNRFEPRDPLPPFRAPPMQPELAGRPRSELHGQSHLPWLELDGSHPPRPPVFAELSSNPADAARDKEKGIPVIVVTDSVSPSPLPGIVPSPRDHAVAEAAMLESMEAGGETTER
jgi:hypothetical protein